VVPGAAGQVLGNVGVHEPGAAGFEVDEGIANIRFSFAESFHFGAMQNQAGLKAFEEVVVVRGGAVLGHNLLVRFAGLSRLAGLFWFFHGLGHNL